MKIEIRYEWICWHLILTILELMLLKCSRSNRPVWSNLVRATSAFSIQANTTMDSILDLIDYNLSLSICVRSAAWAEQALIVYFCKKIDSLNSPLLLVLPRLCYCLYFIWFFLLFVCFVLQTFRPFIYVQCETSETIRTRNTHRLTLQRS